jgi:hypothetical protein
MGDLSGLGLGESIANTVGSITNFDDASDVGDVALNTATMAIDGLGFLANPVDALATSIIGFLLEHLQPMRWALDMTFGDPEAVQNTIKQWNDSALVLDEQAKGYAKAPETRAPTYLHGNSPSAAALAAFVPFRAEQISGAAAACAQVAQETAQAAALVAATRGLIRDAIAAFVWDLLQKAVTRLAFAPLTFGGAAGAFVAETIYRTANELKFHGKALAELLEKLQVVVANLRKVTDKLDRYLSVTRAVGPMGKLRVNPTAVPKLALDFARETMKADDAALATSDESSAEAVRDQHQRVDDEDTREERNAGLPPPVGLETEDWWTRRGTLD